mgnify:CR=1 FL=1
MGLFAGFEQRGHLALGFDVGRNAAARACSRLGRLPNGCGFARGGLVGLLKEGVSVDGGWSKAASALTRGIIAAGSLLLADVAMAQNDVTDLGIEAFPSDAQQPAARATNRVA